MTSAGYVPNEAGEWVVPNEPFEAVVAQAIRLTEARQEWRAPEPEETEITAGLFVRRRLNEQETVVSLRFADDALRDMDRRQFRAFVSERLSAAGDALMAGWDRLHGEE